jgi:two-component system, NtrC family, sensor histidine kinase PilS
MAEHAGGSDAAAPLQPSGEAAQDGEASAGAAVKASGAAAPSAKATSSDMASRDSAPRLAHGAASTASSVARGVGVGDGDAASAGRRGATPADSLVGVPAAPSPEPQLGEPERRMAWLMFLRTLVVSGVLGLSLWLSAAQAPTPASVWLLSSIIVTTYVLNVLFGLLLRSGHPAARLAAWQLSGDLVVNSLLVYVTGGAPSPYTFLFALTVVAAGALLYRRGAIVAMAASLLLLIAIAVLSWTAALPIPLAGQLQPWTQTANEFARTLGINLGALLGVGALAILFGDQLQRTAQSLASERRAVADLYTLHRDIVRSLTSGLITTDPEGRVLTVNATAAELLDRDPDSATGLPIEAVLPGISELLGGDARSELRRVDLVIPRPHEALTLGVSVSPLFDVRDAVIGRVVHFQDLSSLRRMEAHVRRAERLATVGQLAAGVAHEIRNPLASISGSIELLRQAPQVSDDDRSLMTIVTREIERLNALITELLEYANPRPLQAAPFDLEPLLRETLQMAQQERDEVGLALNVTGPLEVTADASKLRQVIWNLVHNARDAARDGGGHVVVRAHPHPSIRGWIEIVVTDDGPGMSAAVVKRIFDPFFTTKRRGTGLGLATCHSIITDHRGRIDVHSVEGGGTRMHVQLPRTPAEASAEHRTAVPSERIRRATVESSRRSGPLPRLGG